MYVRMYVCLYVQLYACLQLHVSAVSEHLHEELGQKYAEIYSGK